MIGDLLFYIKKKLTSGLTSDSSQPILVFLSAQDDDCIKFPKDAITMLLINMEKDETSRVDNQFIKKQSEGSTSEYYAVFPDVRLNLYLLFVANWGDYKTGLDRLSEVITYFQANRVFADTDDPDFPPGVEKFVVEFMTLPFAQQNEVWSSLRTTYRPSSLYKIRALIFQQSKGTSLPLTTKVETDLKEL